MRIKTTQSPNKKRAIPGTWFQDGRSINKLSSGIFNKAKNSTDTKIPMEIDFLDKTRGNEKWVPEL